MEIVLSSQCCVRGRESVGHAGNVLIETLGHAVTVSAASDCWREPDHAFRSSAISVSMTVLVSALEYWPGPICLDSSMRIRKVPSVTVPMGQMPGLPPEKICWMREASCGAQAMRTRVGSSPKSLVYEGSPA